MFSRSITFLLAFALVLTAGIAGPNFRISEDGVSMHLTSAEARRSSYSSSSYRSSSSSYRSSSRSSSSSLWNRKSSYSDNSRKKSYSSSYSSSSTSKPKPSTKTASKTTTSSGKTYGSSSKSTGSSSAKKPATSSFAKAAQTQSSKKVLTDRQKRQFAYNDSRPNKTVKTTSYSSSPIMKSYQPVSRSAYRSTRTNYYSSWNTPNYAYRGSSSYGMWDALFLWMILDSVNDNKMVGSYYHHQNDPGMIAWRNEANEMAKDNAELKAKLDALDKKVAGMNGEIDPSYVPDGVPAAAYMASSVITKPNTEKLIVGTGGKSGMYFQTCELAKKHGLELGLPVECVNTRGSLDNGEKLAAGKVHGAFMQADALAEMAQTKDFRKLRVRQTDVYKEVVYLLVNRNSGIDDVSDLDESDISVYTLGGGAKTTLKSFAKYDSDYVPVFNKANALPANEAGLEMLAKDPKSAAFFVCAPKCGLMDRADARFGDKLKLLPVNDWSFNDAEDAYGNKIYEFETLERRYTNLQDAGMFDDGSLETITVSAVFVMNQDWLSAYGERKAGGVQDFQLSFLKARADARNIIGQE